MIKGLYILESLIMEYDIHIKNGEIIELRYPLNCADPTTERLVLVLT